MSEKDKLRIDKFLWAIRIFKTRNLAADACNNGKVKCGGNNVKPAKTVAVGDEFEIKTPAKKWVIKVESLLHTRVGYEEAIKHYIDLSPEITEEQKQYRAFVFQTGKRQSKQGRPTKKQKRDLDQFLG